MTVHNEAEELVRVRPIQVDMVAAGGFLNHLPRTVG